MRSGRGPSDLLVIRFERAATGLQEMRSKNLCLWDITSTLRAILAKPIS